MHNQIHHRSSQHISWLTPSRGLLVPNWVDVSTQSETELPLSENSYGNFPARLQSCHMATTHLSIMQLYFLLFYNLLCVAIWAQLAHTFWFNGICNEKCQTAMQKWTNIWDDSLLPSTHPITQIHSISAPAPEILRSSTELQHKVLMMIYDVWLMTHDILTILQQIYTLDLIGTCIFLTINTESAWQNHDVAGYRKCHLSAHSRHFAWSVVPGGILQPEDKGV